MREESKLVMGHSLQKLFNRQNVAHHSSVMEINEKHDKCRAKAEERCRLFDKNSEISTIAVSCRSNSCCLWASQTTHKSEKHFKDVYKILECLYDIFRIFLLNSEVLSCRVHASSAPILCTESNEQ